MRSYHVMDMIDRLPLGGSLDNANDSCIVPILYLKHCGHQKIIEMRMATATAIDCSWSSQTKWMLRQIGWWISKKNHRPLHFIQEHYPLPGNACMYSVIVHIA